MCGCNDVTGGSEYSQILGKCRFLRFDPMRYLSAVVVVSGGLLISIGVFLQWRRLSRRSTFRKKIGPHPNWQPGDKLPSPFKDAEYISLDPAKLPASDCYPLLISGVVPRPIAFVSSLSSDGVGNLAPFSYFGAAAHDPPCIVFSVCRSKQRGGNEKDTAKNVLETKEFVVNVISEWFIEAANYTCAPLDPDINEMELVNLTPVPSVKVKPPRVEESAFQMECRLRHHYDVLNKEGKVHSTIFVGEVLLFHVNEAVTETSPSGKLVIDAEKFKPMSRLGGNDYGQITSVFDLPRPNRTS